MSSCIKCQASLQEVSKFCRRCGAEQVIKSEQKAGANDITSSFSVDNKPSTVSSIDIVTDHTTKKMTTNPLPSPPINAVTMPMTQIVEQKRKRGLLIGVGIFLVMIAFGAAMTYGVIYHLNSLRTNLPSIKKTSNPSTGVKALESETTATPISTPTATPVFTPAPTATPESFPTPPKPTPPSEPIKERPKVNPPEIKESDEGRDENQNENQNEDQNEDQNNKQVRDTGILGVKFKLLGKAIVRVKGAQIYVIPLEGGSVTDVNRLVVNPLPSKPFFIVGRQQASDPVNILLAEKPLPKNQFTATFIAESRASNINQSVVVELGIRWQVLAR